MKAKKGFTLIELMVVVLIVSILAAVAIPILRGRIDAAKWSEGKAMMGSIGTSIRAYAAEKGPSGALPTTLGVSNTGLGFDITSTPCDLDGTYFSVGDFGFTCATLDPLVFTVTCTAGGGGSTTEPPSTPGGYTYTSATGVFTAN